MSAVKEEVLEELEVLRAIYDHDFEERPSTWQNVPSFAIRVMPTQNSVHHHNTECFVIVKFTLPVAYPKIAPKVEIEKSAGLSQKESLELSKVIEEQIKANLNSVMCHEVIVGIRSFLETLGNYVPESFYDAMIRKEKEKDNMLRNLKDAAEDSDTKESSLQQKSHALSPVKRPFSKENSMMSHVNTTKILEEIDKLQVEDQSLNHLSTSKIVMDNKKKTLSIPNPTPSRSFRAKNKKSVFDELEDIEEESDEFDSDDKQPSNSKAPVFDYSKSRYAQEFEPMQLLGNGASGEVWKVKHKLDQKIYAVKKINLNYKNNSLRHKIQREVTTISSLFHKNIVRYYAAWIEQYEEILPVESGDNPKSSSKTASTSNMGKEKFISNTESKGNSSNAWLTGNPFAKEAEKELDRNNFALNDYSIMFSEGNDGSSGKDINLGVSSGFGFKPTRYSHIYNYGNSSSSDDSSSSSEEESSDSSESSVSEKSKEESQGERKRNSDWLFIQMEYCYTTLRAFIDETELWKRPVEVKRLFREMLEALAYVHDRKVIHRDLKPANVFLDGEGNIKLGDFGLATRRKKDSRQPKSPSKGLLSHHDFNTSSDYIDHSSHGNHPQIISVTNEAATVDDSLTIGIGTALYRAPEQEMVHSGSHNAAFSVPYNQKADMYSLGIILFEMCHPKFDTQMERFTTLKRLRESQLFPDLFNDSNFPSKELVKIIKWLTNQDPKDRPSATELLSSDLFPSKFDAIDSKYIEELNEAINRPNSLVSLKVLLTLFNKMKFLKEYESSSQFLKEILFNNLSFYIRSFQKDQKLMSYRLLKENVSTFVNKRAQGNAAASLSSTRDHGQSLIVNSLLYLNCLKKHLREIFEIHGGVEYSNQYLELKTSASEYVYYNPYLKKASSSSGYPICEYLDKNGQTLLLPNNLVTPFARIAAFLNLTVAQRFAFEKIYYSSSSTNEKSVATLLNFGNNIQSSQPEVLNEAIYDVIVPANSSIHAIMAEYEILSCTRAFLKRYRQLIPSYFVRLGHSLLTDALMGIICLDIHVNKLRGGNTPGNPNSATPNNQQQTKHEHNASNLAGEREKTGTTTNLDDISVKIRKVLSLCNEIQNEKELHDLVFDQKLPAYQASKVTTFCRSYIRQARVSRENPLFLLSCIEKAFYDSIDVQEISKSQEKEVQEVKPAAPAILNAPVKKIDISEIRLDQIGVKRNVKPNKKQQEDKATKVNEKPPTINPVKAEDKSQKNTNIYEEEVKKYAKMFHRGLKHLQILLEMIISSSNADDQNFLSSVVLDMGIESINLPRNINIFHGQGLIFLVEVVANGSFPSTLTNEGNDESREQDDEPSTNLSKLNEDSSVLKRKLMMQRRKGATVIVSGGHYEQIISEYKEQYNAFESWSDSISVFACASVFYLHNILSVLQKSETRKTFATILPSKDSGKSQSIDSYFLTHSQHLQPMRLQALVVSSQQYTSSLSTNTVSGTSQARTTSLSPMNVPNLKASSAPAAGNSTLLKQGHHQASNQIDNSPGFNYGLTYKPYFLTSVIKVLEILRGHGISASGYLSQLHGYNLSSSNILDFCKRLSIPHLVIVDENNERNTEEITVHSLSVNESTKELTFVENSIHISKLAEYVLSFSANPSDDKRSIGIHSDLLKPLPANQSGNKKNLTKDGNSSVNSSNPATNNAATLKEGLTAKAIQAINQESDKRLFLFYPIINFESHEYGYLQASSSVSNKDNREFNHSFNSKKKRKDIDQLFMNLIVQISFLTSDIFPSSGSAMLPGNSSNGPASSTNNKTSNEGNSSGGNSIGKPSGSSSANSNNNPQGLAGNHQSPSSSVSSPNLTQLLQQYQIKLIYELSNNQLLFSNQHFFYDRIRNLKIFKLIIGLEMNFAIIRAINTLLMNPKILNNFSLLKNELNNNHFFNLYDVTSNSRKLVKNYLLSLITLSNQIISFQNQSSSSSSFSSSSGNTNNLQGNMGSSQANISSNSSSSSSGNSNRTGKYVLYLYSLPDDSIDSLHFTPETLILLKSVV